MLTREQVREALEVAYCATCQKDTMPFPNGCCAFCDRHIVTGELDPVMRAETVAGRRRERNRVAVARMRDRRKQAA